MFRLVSQVRTYLPKAKVSLPLSPASVFLAANPNTLLSIRNFSNTLITMAEPESPEYIPPSSSSTGGGDNTGVLGAQPGDITCTCADCQQSFIHPVADQEFYTSKGWTNLPIRCPACRKAKKESSRRDTGGYSSGYGNRGGYGDRGAPRSSSGGGPSTCYKCGQEGHFARECPSAPSTGGGRGAPGSCFNCGQEGHLSRDCPQPRAPREGGRDSGPRGAPGACYNCGQEGHLSRDCPQPRAPRRDSGRDAGPRSSGGPSTCYKCGQEGHFARECPSAPSGGSSYGGGRGGGGGGYSRGGGGGGGGGGYGNRDRSRSRERGSRDYHTSSDRDYRRDDRY